jgi:hypothetical protein
MIGGLCFMVRISNSYSLRLYSQKQSGDSQSHIPGWKKPKACINRTLAWLKFACGDDRGPDGRLLPSFHDAGSLVDSGDQFDSAACGVFALNAIRHAVFGENLLTQSQVFEMRIRYCLEIIEARHIEVWLKQYFKAEFLCYSGPTSGYVHVWGYWRTRGRDKRYRSIDLAQDLDFCGR